MNEFLAGLLLSLMAAAVGVWGVTRRNRTFDGHLDDAMLGFPRLQRWDASYRPPRFQKLRSNFPRIEVGGWLIIAISAMILFGVGYVGYQQKQSWDADRGRDFDRNLTAIIQARQAAIANPDLEAAWASLNATSADLQQLATTTAGQQNADRIATAQMAIDQALVDLAGKQQPITVQTLGSLPAPGPGVTPRLVLGGGKVFVVAGALYQLDPASSTLIYLLQAGDVVNGHTVETIRAAAWRDDRLMVLDAQRAYTLDPATGAWTAETLGVFDPDGFTDIRSATVFDTNLFVLAPESGQILKFQAGLFSQNPEDWTAGLAREDLRNAVDMVIDGGVWVLLRDGKVLSFFRSRLEATLDPAIVPPITGATGLELSTASPFLYVLSDDGRILRISREGELVQQFTSGISSPLAGAVDLVIDDTNGIGYVMSANTIYTFRVPAAPGVTVDPTATP